MKKIFRILLMAALTLSLSLQAYAQTETAGQETPSELRQLYAQSAVLMDADSGRILFEKNGYEQRPMASTTKIMTCILALEEGDLQMECSVSENAASSPEVRLGVREGESYLLDAKDILYIDTADKRTFLYTREAVYESTLRLYELEEGLGGLEFLRSSRSALVNFRRVQSIRPELGGRLLVTMEGGERLYVSRQYAAAWREKLRELERSFGG